MAEDEMVGWHHGHNGYGFVYMMLPLVFAEIMEDPGSKFRKIVDKQIHLLMINDAKKAV